MEFCVGWENDPFCPDVSVLLEFLLKLFNEGMAYRTLNVVRSAVSAVAIIEGSPAGQHHLIKRFMRAAHNKRPALPRYNQTWDPDVALTYLSKLGANDQLSLLMLGKKLTFLLLLLSGQRFQTISLFDIRYMSLSSSNVCFYVTKPMKTTTPHSHVGEIVFTEFPRDRNICVLHTLSAYLARSEALRGPTNELLITSTIPHRAASRDTLTRWTRDIMLGAGINVDLFRPYSVKAAGVSKAAQTLSLNNIMSSVGWKRESTFRTFYNMPVYSQGEFGAAVLVNM